MRRAGVRSSCRRARGVTLVELMVGLAVGLLVSLLASAVYLAARQTSQVTQSVTDLGETGQLALELIGREIQKAGFYPAQFGAANQPQLPGVFTNTKEPGNLVFDQGVFGCDGASYDPATRACAATVAGAPDGLVVNYFATPEFGAAAAIGNHRDCNGIDVAGDAANAPAVAASQPLFVSNRFGLVATNYTTPAGNAVATRSLGCHGNGDEAATAAEAHLAGIEDLVLRYGVYSNPDLQTPDRFYTASDVAALPTVDGLTPWQRVVAIRVCLVARTPEAARQEDKAGHERTFADCRGNDITLDNADRTLLRRFDRVYAVRNHLKGAL
jgi:type IV pilus assembly protein PilW